jgi:hypothetical protein
VIVEKFKRSIRLLISISEVCRIRLLFIYFFGEDRRMVKINIIKKIAYTILIISTF